jgi:pimeloyl-ACP methyl ester carboxylesterase
MRSSRVEGSALIKILFASLAITLLLCLLAGSVYQRSQQQAEQEQFPPPGQIVDVDGVSLHIDCRGQGSPTVLIESGLMSGSPSWGLVHDPLAQLTRVCAYDRAGMAWSEPSDEPLRAELVVQRLHRLLTRAGVEDKMVLMGMSAGGVFVREYYLQHPEDVVGMVLVDSSHEQQGSRLPELNGIIDLSALLRACSWMQPIGIVRALELLDESMIPAQLNGDLALLLRAQAYQSHTCEAMLNESDGFDLEVVDIQPPQRLGNLPLLVLSQGKRPADDELEGLSREQADDLIVRWNDLQQELAALSTNSRRVIARESGHLIHLEQPELLISEVSQMIATLQQN